MKFSLGPLYDNQMYDEEATLAAIRPHLAELAPQALIVYDKLVELVSLSNNMATNRHLFSALGAIFDESIGRVPPDKKFDNVLKEKIYYLYVRGIGEDGKLNPTCSGDEQVDNLKKSIKEGLKVLADLTTDVINTANSDKKGTDVN